MLSGCRRESCKVVFSSRDIVLLRNCKNVMELNRLCFYANATLQLCSKDIVQLLMQRKSSVLSWNSCFDKAVETNGENIRFFYLPVWHKTDFLDKNSAEYLCWREPQIELITWHVQSPGLCGLKHYRHFNSVLCNKHQHRRRGNQFQYNCPKMSFLPAIIPHGSQSKHSHWQRWRLFTLARWTFITTDFCCLQPFHFYTL